MPLTQSSFFIGCDLGQSQDYSALTIAEKVTARHSQQEVWDYAGTPPALPPPRYAVRYLRRWPLQTSYPQIVRDVKTLLERPELQKNSTLAIDATGCGAPVLDMFKEAHLPCSLYGVFITGGNSVSREGIVLRVPKRDLVGVVNVLLQSRTLDIVPTLSDASLLTAELTNFKMKIDPITAHDSYGEWRTGQHDDMVLATAVALWIGEKGPSPPVIVRYLA